MQSTDNAPCVMSVHTGLHLHDVCSLKHKTLTPSTLQMTMPMPQGTEVQLELPKSSKIIQHSSVNEDQ